MRYYHEKDSQLLRSNAFLAGQDSGFFEKTSGLDNNTTRTGE